MHAFTFYKAFFLGNNPHITYFVTYTTNNVLVEIHLYSSCPDYCILWIDSKFIYPHHLCKNDFMKNFMGWKLFIDDTNKNVMRKGRKYRE